jgi:hypothetical protein
MSVVTATARASAPCRRVAPLPSCTYIISASHAYIIGASYTNPSFSISCLDSIGTGTSWCKTIGREELGGALVGLPTLAAEGATRVGCGGVTTHETNQLAIGDVEVPLLPPRNHL